MSTRTAPWTIGLTVVTAVALQFSSSCGASSPLGGREVDNGGAGGGGFISGSGGGSGGGTGGSDGGFAGCTTAAECPSGYTCEASQCIPPEQEIDHGVGNAPPVATPRYVFALNPTASSVARIDPVSLAIEAIPVGPNPVGLAALPNEDAAVVLSLNDGSLSVVDASVFPSKVSRVKLPRQYANLTVSADGRWAVAWPSSTAAPVSGAEGIFALVDLQKARANAPVSESVKELGGGYRLTDVVFRLAGGVATRLHVFAKSSISTFDLPSTTALPVRLPLPATMTTDVTAREVVASADGTVIMVRSTLTAELASFDGTAIAVVPLPEVATDLDLLPDGSAAVAALRVSGQVAYIEIPADLLAPAGIDLITIPSGTVGQIALPPAVGTSGMFAYIYSNITGGESFARVDLPSGTVTTYPLEKLVDEIAISPDGLSAVVIHRADPATTATDPYEAAVDRDQGFSVFDVATGYWQLQRTARTKPTRYAFSPAGGFIGVALRNDQEKKFALQAVNLTTLVSTTLTLASTPLYMGTVPQAPGVTPHRVFVSQEHPAGRISVIQLDSGQVRTATGFTLNAEIQ